MHIPELIADRTVPPVFDSIISAPDITGVMADCWAVVTREQYPILPRRSDSRP